MDTKLAEDLELGDRVNYRTRRNNYEIESCVVVGLKLDRRGVCVTFWPGGDPMSVIQSYFPPDCHVGILDDPGYVVLDVDDDDSPLWAGLADSPADATARCFPEGERVVGDDGDYVFVSPDVRPGRRGTVQVASPAFEADRQTIDVRRLDSL